LKGKEEVFIILFIILLLEIYTNIAINPHGTRGLLSLPLSCSP